ncbi:MAG: response regulator [Hyphomonadaceae bacterium]|nr:response regulator [Hyphomonadaceae bacterium]
MASPSDLHVLLVDDNRQMRTLLRSLLRAAGVGKISDAADADQAFQLMTESQIDLILLDWKMRPMDGLAFTRLVRQAPNSPNPYATILMLTAHTERHRVASARDAGVSGFLKKPISAHLLFERMTNALADDRMFVRAPGFFGPDRRFGALPGYGGPFRRASDTGALETFDL